MKSLFNELLLVDVHLDEFICCSRLEYAFKLLKIVQKSAEFLMLKKTWSRKNEDFF